MLPRICWSASAIAKLPSTMWPVRPASARALFVCTGKSDIFNGVLGAYDQSYINQLVSDTSAWLAQLQDAGLIRRELSASAVTYLITAQKIGIVYLPDMIGGQYTPSIEELAEGMSDLIRRWLEPDILPSDSRTGKDIGI